MLLLLESALKFVITRRKSEIIVVDFGKLSLKYSL